MTGAMNFMFTGRKSSAEDDDAWYGMEEDQWVHLIFPTLEEIQEEAFARVKKIAEQWQPSEKYFLSAKLFVSLSGSSDWDFLLVPYLHDCSKEQLNEIRAQEFWVRGFRIPPPNYSKSE